MDINILLFDDFESLDVFDPVEILGRLKEHNLKFISMNGEIIKSRQGTEIITHSFCETDGEYILLIPGGQGTRALVNDEIFIQKLYKMALSSKYCLTVCTGSALLAKTGILNGLRATSNKRAFDWVTSVNKDVLWVQRARWITEGKFYTSSGVSAGMDMALGFISDLMGMSKAREIAYLMEYIWNDDSSEDKFV